MSQYRIGIDEIKNKGGKEENGVIFSIVKNVKAISVGEFHRER